MIKHYQISFFTLPCELIVAMERRSFFCWLTASGLMCSYIDITRAPIVLTVIEANFRPKGVETFLGLESEINLKISNM